MPTEAAGRGVRIKLLAIFLLLCMAGLLYAYVLSIPAAIAGPLAVASALEAVFYVATVWEVPRRSIEKRLRAPALALVMTASGILPYLLYAVPCGVFRWENLAEVAALAALLSFWFVLLPKRSVVNVVFIALVAAGLLSGVFQPLYGEPAPKLKLGIMGDLMWTRLAIAAILSVARIEVKGSGFFPNRMEWRAGVLNYALFLPAGVLLGWLLEFARYSPRPYEWWQMIGLGAATFLGMFWVVALREEFFFRGLLQEWISGWTKSDAAALVVASVLFGLVHLPFRGFPNWRMVTLATVAGLCYGRAYMTARSVRAAMVTHALVNTTWRLFFN